LIFPGLEHLFAVQKALLEPARRIHDDKLQQVLTHIAVGMENIARPEYVFARLTLENLIFKPNFCGAGNNVERFVLAAVTMVMAEGHPWLQDAPSAEAV